MRSAGPRAVVVALSWLAACGSEGGAACPPHADFYFASALTTPGTYQLELQAIAGVSAACQAEVSQTSFASGACSAPEVSWIVSDVDLVGVHLEGTSEIVELRLFDDDGVLGNVSIHPTYMASPSACGACAPCAVESVPLP